MRRSGTIAIFLCFFVFILLGNFQNAFSQNQTKGEEQSLLASVSPMPGSIYLSKSTNIILKFYEDIKAESLNSNLFVVEGQTSGRHSGKIILSDDNRTVLFDPLEPFTPGELVMVNVLSGINTKSGNIFQGINFSFAVSPNKIKIQSNGNLDPDELLGAINNNLNSPINSDLDNLGVNKLSKRTDVPSDFPDITINLSDSPAPGYIYLSNFSIDPSHVYTPYLMMLDNFGNPQYYKKLDHIAFDFKRQQTGLYTYYLQGANYFYGMDSTFAVVDSFYCGNGYQTDVHDLVILPNGNFLIIGDDIETVDMSKIVSGGNPEAQVTGIIIQELDKNRQVVFQWRSWDHFNITDATHEDLTAAKIDPFHTNAIDLDTDGNILISSRHTDEITKINRQNGQIMWRLGGKNNQFSFINDPIGFSHQHAVRRIANGDITLFDDGNFHTPQFSRAVEYSLDEQNMTATLVWQFRNTPDVYGNAMGYVQRLSNGNTLIGWGTSSTVAVTEVRPDGTKAYELSLPKNEWSYRAFKFDNSLPPENLVVSFNASLNDSLVQIGILAILNGRAPKFYMQRKLGEENWQEINQFNNPASGSDSLKFNYIDNLAGTNYVGNIYYRIEQIYDDSSIAYSNQQLLNIEKTPQSYVLFNNFPNPFNPATIIKYEIPFESHVRLAVYNILGQLMDILEDGIQNTGNYERVWDAKNISSGVYIYELYANSIDGTKNFSATKKMVLLK